jgi:hypothetical protein
MRRATGTCGRERRTWIAGRGRVRRVALALAALVLFSGGEIQAQSSGLGWLKDIERWTHEEDWRTWLGHGVVTTAATLFGHWAFDRAHLGAGAAVMFYVGLEYQELRRDDWVVHDKLDKFMDLAVPIAVGTILVTVLSGDETPREPPFLPTVDEEEAVGQEEDLPHFFPGRVARRGRAASGIGEIPPMLSFRRNAADTLTPR